jgi:hypothetical protein
MKSDVGERKKEESGKKVEKKKKLKANYYQLVSEN